MRQLSPRRVFAWYLLGTLLVQAAWILALPAFRGSDEFDHVFKAAAVVRGQWTAPDPAPHGRGGIVTVPRSLVTAASPVCLRYKYVGHDNCFPIRKTSGKDVEVATSAGAYNPTYYLLVGWPSLFLGGATADFAMRVISALLCAVLVAAAAGVTARWAVTAWPLLALSVGLTPVLLYSTSIVSPNGVTYASATLLWACLLQIHRTDDDSRGLLALTATAAVLLVATHTSGTMWLALIGVAVLLLRPLRDWWSLLARKPARWLAAVGVVLVAAVLCVAWIRVVHTNALGGPTIEGGPFPFARVPVFEMLWMLQSIAVFPMRNEPAPIPVYLLWIAPLAVVVFSLFRNGRTRERLAAGGIFVMVAVVPVVLTYLAFAYEGWGWQGRYSLPLLLGITALAGLVLDRRPADASLWIRISLYVLLGSALVTSSVRVTTHEVATGTLDPVFPSVGGYVLVGVLAALGAMAFLLALRTDPPVTLSHEGTQSPQTAGLST